MMEIWGEGEHGDEQMCEVAAPQKPHVRSIFDDQATPEKRLGPLCSLGKYNYIAENRAEMEKIMEAS